MDRVTNGEVDEVAPEKEVKAEDQGEQPVAEVVIDAGQEPPPPAEFIMDLPHISAADL